MAWFFVTLGVFGVIVLVLFATLSLAAGMYYLAELIEEYTTVAAKIFRYLIFIVIFIIILLTIFEDVTWGLVISLLISQLCHLGLLTSFPSFFALSPYSIGTILTFVANHYFGIQYFATNWHHMYEVFSFFTICVWIVPFLFFVSLTANESVLPTTISPDTRSQFQSENSDLLTNYFGRRPAKANLLNFLKSAQEKYLPKLGKKSF